MARTFLTIYVATLEGLIVQAIVKKVGTSSFLSKIALINLQISLATDITPFEKMAAIIKYKILWIN